MFSFFIFLLSCQSQQVWPGDSAPEFDEIRWIQSNALQLNKLKGKVVLIRWWTDECEYCIHSADALNEWYELFADSGLVVIGMYHPKPEPRSCSIAEVTNYVRDKNFHFPIGIDDEWKNLNRFWLNAKRREFTSVSFLLDRQGIIRHIHPGGEYHKSPIEGHGKCVKDYFEFLSAIRKYIYQ